MIIFQEAVNPVYLLAWIPESLLHERGTTEWDKFIKIEEKAILDEEDEGKHLLYFCSPTATA
jgi:TBC1 domain family member 15